MLNGSFPGFAPEGGTGLALLRGLWLATLLSGFGAALFRLVVARGDGGVARASLAAALPAGLLWLVAQAAAMADASGFADVAAAVRTVVAHTAFGQALALQLALLAAALAVSRRPLPSALLAGAALLLNVSHGHAWAMGDGAGWLVLSEAAHLLAAGAWLGALLPLALLVAHGSPAEAARASRRFAPLGTACVAALAVSAAYQSSVLVGSVAGLFGSAYGWTALAKLALLLAMAALAARHRWRLTPALDGAAPDAARSLLARGIAIEAGAGLCVVAAAGLLASLPPAVHVQPVWPFAERLSLDTVREDADFMREAAGAGLALAGALALLAAAAFLRPRARWGAVAGACVVVWLAAPHLELLFVEAHPTSFYRSPTGFSVAAIGAGAALYPASCAGCHGAEGRGDGPAGRALPVPPADLTAAHLWMHADGEMFWWLAHGIEGPDGAVVMPGFSGVLSDEQRWDLVDAVRARNAGLAFAATGAWPVPLRAPDFSAVCDGAAVRLSDLLGAPALVTLTDGGARVTQADRRCEADDAGVPAAYALVAGLPPGGAAGAKVLVDGAGFLRAVQQPGETDWNDPARLSAEMARVQADPLAAAEPARMEMSGGAMHM